MTDKGLERVTDSNWDRFIFTRFGLTLINRSAYAGYDEPLRPPLHHYSALSVWHGCHPYYGGSCKQDPTGLDSHTPFSPTHQVGLAD